MGVQYSQQRCYLELVRGLRPFPAADGARAADELAALAGARRNTPRSKLALNGLRRSIVD